MRTQHIEFSLFFIFYFLNQNFGLLEIEKLIDATKTCLSVEQFSQVNLVTESIDLEELSLEYFQKSLFIRIETW